MSILASAQWWIRVSGNELNGGGYDAAISGAGTNYADQDSAQLSLTDLATPSAGSTTLTSATGGFTSAMIGNCIRIASGTNFQAGYYFVTARTNANTVTLDRTPSSGGAGSAGVGRLGGAHASFVNYAVSAGGSAPSPAITTPLAAGHTINIRGSGSDNPSSSDYDFSTGYWTTIDGDLTTGAIKLKGYNGRPRISHHGLIIFQADYWLVDSICFFQVNSTFTGYGPISTGISGNCSARNCKFDQNGYDAQQFVGRTASLWRCEFLNSGSQTAGTVPVVLSGHVFTSIIGCTFHGLRGPAVKMQGNDMFLFANLFYGNNSDDVLQGADDISLYGDVIFGNTFYGGAGHGINVATGGAAVTQIQNNIFSGKPSGKYAITFSDSEALNRALIRFEIGNNFFYNNNANYSNFSAQSDDVQLSADPFTNAGGNDFSLNTAAGGGAAVRGAAAPTSWPGLSMTNYLDGGAAQAQASAGGGAGPRIMQVGGGLGIID